MLKLQTTGQFKKDLKQADRRGLDLNKLTAVIDILQHQKPLDTAYRDHPLKGQWVRKEWSGTRELHIAPDWLLIYLVKDGALILRRTGSHVDLYGHSH